MADKNKGVFIAATGQHVGKTTLSLGLTAVLKKHLPSVGFIKPVGQQHVTIDNVKVDKDVVLIKRQFDLNASWGDMSPVIIPSGFTKLYLDGGIDSDLLLNKIVECHERISHAHSFTLVEGTGHVGVGSILELSNARVASKLGLDIILISSGGLGSAFDELSLNLSLLKAWKVKVKGVILNKVLSEKKEMIEYYITKALNKHDIPVIGVVPYDPFLSKPTIQDFETLFETKLLSGESHRMRHFDNVRLVAGSVDAFYEELLPNQLIITPASRKDIIDATLMRHQEEITKWHKDYQGGLILTGRQPPLKEHMEAFKKVDMPILYAPLCSYDAMQMITSFTAKIQMADSEKIEKAIHLIEDHIDLNFILPKTPNLLEEMRI